MPHEAFREAEQLPEPVECHLLELLQRRRRAPQDADLVEADEELREDPGLGAGRREVREEARALPVREPGARTASRSRSTVANGSGESGAELGSAERRAPGSTRARTGRSRTPSR